MIDYGVIVTNNENGVFGQSYIKEIVIGFEHIDDLEKYIREKSNIENERMEMLSDEEYDWYYTYEKVKIKDIND